MRYLGSLLLLMLSLFPMQDLAASVCQTRIMNASQQYVSFYVGKIHVENLLGTNAGKVGYPWVINSAVCYSKEPIIAVMRNSLGKRFELETVAYYTDQGQVVTVTFPDDFA